MRTNTSGSEEPIQKDLRSDANGRTLLRGFGSLIPSFWREAGRQPRRWITDMGEPLILTDEKGESRDIGRYGVWEEVRGKAECVDCGSDLLVLRAYWGVEEGDVVSLARKRSPSP